MSDAWAKWRSCVRAVDLYPADNPNRAWYLEREHAAAQIAVRNPAASGGADQEDAALAELRKLSRKAVLLDWEARGSEVWADGGRFPVAECGDGSDPRSCDDATFIAAAVNYVRSRLAPSTDPAPEPRPEIRDLVEGHE